ncbi:SAM-dependent methyltransferase [Jeongeupia chitinilytica]|uniref:Cyclopropane-fatty-acyl-phospholipid synthase n=1 Tax=Jeongeupia chitinilytica TaxID=1041641 RepID=A0ABQ3H1Q9_9NEIS|nr:cyclopropane-fatty-acyl-phospholipid synthase family protein [Jeongeupia chitinilytica]GHD64277.1 cyclopropane-fatty-acyl-phospholipid synthase [Jeongeupia chitinilytica]
MSHSDTLTLSDAPMPAPARVFMSLLARLTEGSLGVITPAGRRHDFGNRAAPHAELVLNDWRACGAILAGGDIGFADAYRNGWLDSPDLAALVRLAIRNDAVLTRALFGGRLARLWYALRHRLRANTRGGSRRNIHAHYDLGNDFYARWLDPGWSYSSALFDGDLQRPLFDAQCAKYQRIIDRLQLRAGMQVLEIGCGWGGFAEHAARQGIAVHGITLSPSQLRVAQARIADAGLQPLARLELRDYRDLAGSYDAVVSIEMFEAVGERFWPQYFGILRARLRPGGRAMVQSITIDEAFFARYRASSDFIREYIFPGGMLPSVPRFEAAAAASGLATREVFRFGADYAETLRRWARSFESQCEAILAQGFDERFIRVWRLYLAYCEAGFDEGRTDVVQCLLHRQD